MRLRVMVWNVHGFSAGTKAMALAARSADPDIVVLNETGYLGFRLRRFARRLGMEGSTGATLRWRIPNAVLARAPWRAVRGQVVAQMGRSGFRIWMVAVHLGLSGQERAMHARVLTDLFAGRDPAIIGGDLNEDEAGAAARWISSRYWDAASGESAAPTFPSKEPRVRIDYLFTSEGIRVERAWTGGDAYAELSDHRPVFADLSVG